MKKSIILLFCLLGLCAFSFAQGIQDSMIMVVAHRGVHNHFPENSFPAIREAVEKGIDVVEIDIRHTKDSVLVLMHDKTINRTTNGHGLVENYTLAELKKFRLRNTDGTPSKEQIPVLEEIFLLLTGK